MSTLKNSSTQIHTVSKQLDRLLKGGSAYRLSRMPNRYHQKAYKLAYDRVQEVLAETYDKDYTTIIERLVEFKMIPPLEVQDRWFRNVKPRAYWDMAFDDAIDAIKSLMLRFVIGVTPEGSIRDLEY